MDYRKAFEELKRNTIELRFDTAAEGKAEKGASKFGGNPDLPDGFQWSYFTTDTFDDDEAKPRPLAFLAQINCAEVSAYDQEGLLPEKGMLYFFYELGSQKWGFDPADKGCARVFYYAGETEGLAETELPEDMEENSRLPEIPVSFRNRDDVPDWAEYAEYYDAGDDYEEYGEAREKLTGNEEDSGITKLLGYADIIQSDMLSECELVGRRGIDIGHSWPEMTDSEKAQFLKDSQEWILLFQLDTVEKGDFELMFGDCGRIYFFIRKEDLRNRNFENIWLCLQCY